MLIILQVLRSEEGMKLRRRHQENVAYLRDNLLQAGVPALHCPSHIIPIHVSNVWTDRQTDIRKMWHI